MSGLLRRLSWRLGGGNTKGVTVPPMDGALKPNRALEEAAEFVRIHAPDNLVRDGDRLRFTCGPGLYSTDAGAGATSVIEVARFDSDIASLACDGAGGYAVGLDSGDIVYWGALGDLTPIRAAIPLAPTAMAFDGRGKLYVCSGSRTNRPSEWKRDLLERNQSGSVWAFDSDGRGVCLADGLAFPYGVTLAGGESAILVAESWKHRLLLIETATDRKASQQEVVLDDLPGYPARIAAGSNGYWLSVFAPRGQLMEFVLREDEYRQRMIETIEPEFWMAPSLASGRSFLEPLQLGAIRTMGALKAWAPTRSYGLLVHLDSRYQPTGSAHSRSDGTRHGVTSCLQWEDRVLAASKGGDRVLSLRADDFAGE